MKNYQKTSHLAVALSESQIQELLMGRMKNAALTLVTKLFEDDVQRVCGEKFSHKSSTQFRRGGSEKTSVVISGAKHAVRRPRVRGPKGEVQLPSYTTIKHGDILDETMLGHMVEGVSTRGYERVAEEYADRFGISKSSVSRAFVRSSQKDLDAINGSDLSNYDFLALMVDGIVFAKRTLVVALGVTTHGDKVVLGVRDGASENAEVVTDLLGSLCERGFDFSAEHLLVCLDGSKALKKGIQKTFGDRALIQRCYLHKIKNLKGYLPEKHHPEMIRRMRRIMSLNTFDEAKEELNKTQDWIDTFNSEAANSLREVGDELLTVHKLEVTGSLRKSLSSTNLIESLFSVVRSKCSRVRNWNKSSSARMRWVASAAKAHQPRMRKVRGKDQLQKLKIKLSNVEKSEKAG